jgi:proline dehydrogenase
MLRSTLLAAGRSARLQAAAEGSAVLRPLVDRFVAGTDLDAALPVIAGLATDRLVTVDHLGENTTDRSGAEATVAAYRALLLRLAAEGLAERVEVSVKLSALGQDLPDGDACALAGAQEICAAAAEAGTTVTVDMEDHTTTDATLATVGALRADFPWVGAVLQSQLRRTEGDCRELAGPGSRVRLCKGAYDEPGSVAFTERADVDRSYVRCLKILFGGAGTPLVATHDPRLVAIAQHLGRDRDFELQMLYGVRPDAQVELAAAGERMRVYVPYGMQWYGYFMRRLAERPANVAFFLRALATRS